MTYASTPPRSDAVPAAARDGPRGPVVRTPWGRARRVSMTTLLLLAVAGVVVALIVARQGDAAVARRVALRELTGGLEPGETVLRRAPAAQREWWDYWRPSYGVLAVTDRRVLFVGLAPGDLLPHEPEPPAVITASFPYAADHRIDVHRQRVFFGTRPGVFLRAPAEPSQRFGYAPREAPEVNAVLGLLAQRQAALRRQADTERLTALAAAEEARRPLFHRVARGEALELIAARYGRTADQLRLWNRLPGNLIKIGQLLLVKPWT